MGYTNKTTKFQLPQFIKTDKPQMADFNDAFKNIEDMAFPKSGGEISGNIEVKNGLPVMQLNNTSTGRSGRLFSSTDGTLYIRNAKDDNNRMAIYLQRENISNFYNVFRMQKVLNGAATYYSIFGEHNKPVGSYTGNGSAASRTIETGGIGHVVKIHSSKGTAFVTPANGLCYSSGGVDVLVSTASKMVDGVITLATDNAQLNANGVTYYYQVL